MELNFRHGNNRFKLLVHGKFNFIIGDSGTGKTFLSRLLESHELTGSGSYSGKYPLISYQGFLGSILSGEPLEKHVVYIDEFDMHSSSLSAFFENLKRFNCWFIVCLRDLPVNVSFGIEDIFILEEKHKIHNMTSPYSPIVKPLMLED